MGSDETSGTQWARGPSNALDISVDLTALREKLSEMTEAELIAFGKQMRGLCHPITYDGDGKPTVSVLDSTGRSASRMAAKTPEILNLMNVGAASMAYAKVFVYETVELFLRLAVYLVLLPRFHPTEGRWNLQCFLTRVEPHIARVNPSLKCIRDRICKSHSLRVYLGVTDPHVAHVHSRIKVAGVSIHSSCIFFMVAV